MSQNTPPTQPLARPAKAKSASNKSNKAAEKATKLRKLTDEQIADYARALVAAAEAGGGAGDVMIAEGDAGPVAGEAAEGLVVVVEDARQQFVGVQQDEGVGRVQAVLRRAVGSAAFFLFGELAEDEPVEVGAVLMDHRYRAAGVKFRKINAKNPADAAKKIAAWFAKNADAMKAIEFPGA